jgi:Nuclease-related domain.
MRVVHDRRIPRSRANIDHIVIAPRGIYVIDTKHYKQKLVSCPMRLGPRMLYVGRNPRPQLVEANTFGRKGQDRSPWSCAENQMTTADRCTLVNADEH